MPTVHVFKRLNFIVSRKTSKSIEVHQQGLIYEEGEFQGK